MCWSRSRQAPQLSDEEKRSERAKEFHYKEYDSLKKEIEALVEHSRKLEVYAVGAVAAFYVWYLKDACGLPVAPLLFVPVVIAAAAFVRTTATLSRIYELAVYLREVETEYALEKLQGWERHRSNDRDTVKVGKAGRNENLVCRLVRWCKKVKATSTWFMGLLFALTIVVLLLRATFVPGLLGSCSTNTNHASFSTTFPASLVTRR